MQNIQEQNLIARNAILSNASRRVEIIYDGPVKANATIMLVNRGLLTHLTVEGDYSQITDVRLTDFNNMDRIKCRPTHLPHKRNILLLPIASVAFDWSDNVSPDTKIKDLIGAMYMNVVCASSYLALSGMSTGVIIKQYILYGLPVTKRGYPILPVLDLSGTNINTIISRV